MWFFFRVLRIDGNVAAKRYILIALLVLAVITAMLPDAPSALKPG